MRCESEAGSGAYPSYFEKYLSILALKFVGVTRSRCDGHTPMHWALRIRGL